MEGIMIYKTGPSLHRGRERLRKREKILHSLIYCMAFKNSTAFLCIFKGAEDIPQKPLLN